MGEYEAKTHIFAIDICGCDIMLGAKWLHILALVTMGFKELSLNFNKQSHTHTLKWVQLVYFKIINSHL